MGGQNGGEAVAKIASVEKREPKVVEDTRNEPFQKYL